LKTRDKETNNIQSGNERELTFVLDETVVTIGDKGTCIQGNTTFAVLIYTL
jgi:hypothetical protein